MTDLFGRGLVGRYEADATGANKAYVGQAATRCWFPFTQGTAKNGMARTLHRARDDLYGIKLVYANSKGGADGEVPTGGTLRVRASVEYPLGTTPQRAYFNGVDFASVVDGAFVISDDVRLNAKIPAGAEFAVLTYAEHSNLLPLGGYWNNATVGDRIAIATGALTDLTGTADASPGTSGSGYGPTLILSNMTKESIMLVGDSIVTGQADTADYSGFMGSIARSIGGTFAYAHMSAPSEKLGAATGVSNAGRFVVRKQFIKYFSHVVMSYGRNDMARTADVIMTDYRKFIDDNFAEFNIPLYGLTLTPSTTSTDAWATTVNQTLEAQSARRIDVNNRLKAGALPFVTVFDVATAVETARDSGIWKAAYTADGLHPLQAAYIAIADSKAIDIGMFKR